MQTTKKEVRVVMSNSNKTNHSLIHVHVCVHCGSAFRREEYMGRAITSGIYHCPKCGLDGPLNIEIHEVEDLTGNKDNPSDAGSSS
jgi:predicted RNA-binding Zn-ribbon protein involved in translation (DUF1610 family)